MPKLHGSGEIGNLWTPGRSADRCTHAGKPPETVSEVCLRVMSQQPHSCTGRPVNSSSRSIGNTYEHVHVRLLWKQEVEVTLM